MSQIGTHFRCHIYDKALRCRIANKSLGIIKNFVPTWHEVPESMMMVVTSRQVGAKWMTTSDKFCMVHINNHMLAHYGVLPILHK